MQNIQDWTTDICVTDTRVFVKGEVFALLKYVNFPRSCWLLEITSE